MIIESIIKALFGLVKLVFGWIDLPDMPSAITSVVDELFNLFSGAVGLLGMFVDLQFVAVLVPVLILVINFDKVYRLTMFILHKLPIGIN